MTAATLDLDVSRAELYAEDGWREPFAWLRENAPVHRQEDSKFGPYWSVSTYQTIVEVEAQPEVFSSSWRSGVTSITIAERPPGTGFPNFIRMDAAEHQAQRKVVTPAFTPSEMARLSIDIRARAGALLDTLPLGERFDWVDKVSIELTTQMLAVLFDFPWDDRRLLPFWSDVAGNIEQFNDPAAQAERLGHLADMGHYFKRLWDERIAGDAAPDLLSRMIRSDVTGSMDMDEFIGALTLLVIGGNDTTRNTMSGLVFALDQYPDQRAALEADPGLIDNAVSELIRWQTPLAHMRRNAVRDVELAGQTIRAGDKVVLWYISANRDESVFADAERFDLRRDNARRHLAFGYGAHRCVGARLAELQVRILIEELQSRRLRVHVEGEPIRVAQSFVHGFEALPVTLERY
ncbi:cytochrome P450 [Novosphingobium lentum]|uniref:cytochrome P450 n=1 Tax=Novosphingobium lentum TaxID=145287 RepID=UPI00082F5262|nr:cytochrome P450 [Novosphingobium lentum]